MGKTKEQTRRARTLLALCMVATVLACVVLLLLMARPAQGSGNGGNIFGLGEEQVVRLETLEFGERFAVPDANEEGRIDDKNASTAASLAKASRRTIVVKDPDPVVTYAAIDYSDDSTVEQATENGELDPLPTAPHVLPDLTDGSWQQGMASAYDLENNQGWDGTASGIPLTRDSVTVAVPASQSYLLGRTVEIVYGDLVVMATVTDTGGFGGMGRALDLAGGVWRAFGASSCEEWGVRSIYYRFL